MSVNQYIHDVAAGYLAGGLSVIPLRTDGTKAPATKWDIFQQQPPTPKNLDEWFLKATHGIGIVGGGVSGNLEIIDFDDFDAYTAWVALIDDHGQNALMERLPLVETPSGGRHLFYRCPTGVEGNQKLAMKASEVPEGTPGARIILGRPCVVKTMIETRGEGGQVVAPGSPKECHLSRKMYLLRRGDLAAIPTITAGERRGLLECARRINTFTEPERAKSPAAPSGQRMQYEGLKPGEDFNQRGDHLAILEAHGWTIVGRSGDTADYWRPGKTRGSISCSYNYKGDRRIFIFSSNAYPFEQNTYYDAFDVFTKLEHNGEVKDAVKALVAMGYGSQRPPARAPREPSANGDPYMEGDNMGEFEGMAPPPGFDDPLTNDLWEHSNIDGLEGEGKNGPSELTLAIEWAKYAEDKFAYVEGDQYWSYHGGCWSYSSLEEAQKNVQEFLEMKRKSGTKLTINRAKVGGVLFLGKSKIGPHKMREFDAKPGWIGLRNGVFDVATGELISHNPKHLLTHQVPYEYDPAAKCPVWKSFLREVLIKRDGDHAEEWESALQEWFGLSLIPNTAIQVAHMWTGEGSNGKGVATRALEGLIGKEYTTSIPIEMLHDPYHRADLYGKHVGFVNEPDPRAMQKNGSWFKAITGGDAISARRPTEKVFSFTFGGRIVISCNELPSTNDLSNGYFRRIVLIEWRYNVPNEKQDAGLDDKLRMEMPGIFNWAIEGLRRVRANGGKITYSKESAKLLEDYRASEDTFARFFEETCTRDVDSKTPVSNVYRAYKVWCMGSGERLMTSHKVVQRLQKMGFTQGVDAYRAPDNSRKTRKIWRGFCVADEQQEMADPEENR